MAINATTGKNFIQMMRPMLGLENVPGIREIRIVAAHNEVTTLEVDMIANADFDKISADPYPENEKSLRTRKYTVTVTEVME